MTTDQTARWWLLAAMAFGYLLCLAGCSATDLAQMGCGLQGFNRGMQGLPATPECGGPRQVTCTRAADGRTTVCY
jgi:hypothetical protein